MSAGWVTGSLSPRTGAENNPRDRAKLVAEAARAVAAAAGELAVEVEKQQRREADAYDRIADVQKLLWNWVLREHPSGPIRPRYADDSVEGQGWDLGAEAAERRAIEELATILGEDVSPENVLLEMFKRRQELAQQQQKLQP